MDNLLSDYFNGSVNVYAGNLVVGRERLPNGYEYINLSTGEGTVVYEFFYNPRKKVKKDVQPKHCGHKQPYVMLMLHGIRELKCKNRIEIMGAIVALSDNIEWNSGMLIQKRPKRFLKSADIVKIIGWSKSKTFALLKQMKQLEIIEKADEGYRISEKYIRKGAGKNAGKNQK